MFGHVIISISSSRQMQDPSPIPWKCFEFVIEIWTVFPCTIFHNSYVIIVIKYWINYDDSLIKFKKTKNIFKWTVIFMGWCSCRSTPMINIASFTSFSLHRFMIYQWFIKKWFINWSVFKSETFCRWHILSLCCT